MQMSSAETVRPDRRFLVLVSSISAWLVFMMPRAANASKFVGDGGLSFLLPPILLAAGLLVGGLAFVRSSGSRSTATGFIILISVIVSVISLLILSTSSKWLGDLLMFFMTFSMPRNLGWRAFDVASDIVGMIVFVEFIGVTILSLQRLRTDAYQPKSLRPSIQSRAPYFAPFLLLILGFVLGPLWESASVAAWFGVPILGLLAIVYALWPARNTTAGNAR
jgi:hypothetical protein